MRLHRNARTCPARSSTVNMPAPTPAAAAAPSAVVSGIPATSTGMSSTSACRCTR